MSRQEAIKLATQAEQLRIRGDYSNAITMFTTALGQDPAQPGIGDSTYAWAWAHRGAAKAALQDMGSVTPAVNTSGDPTGNPTSGSGFMYDFAKALWIKSLNYPWVHAHWGEAYRIYAANHMWQHSEFKGTEGPATLDPGIDRPATSTTPAVPGWLSMAVVQFNRAIDTSTTTPGGGPLDNAWTHAHRGAAYAWLYFVKQFIFRDPSVASSGDDGSTEADLAEADFRLAIGTNPDDPTVITPSSGMDPTYSWCCAFYALLLTLKSGRPVTTEVRSSTTLRELAEDALHQGMLYDVNHRVRAMTALALLTNYQATAESYAESIHIGWQALQDNPKDFLASYIVTSSSVLATTSVATPLSNGLRNAIKQTRLQLHGVRNQVTALLGGLELLLGQGDAASQAKAATALADIRREPDFETYAVINVDSTWSLGNFRANNLSLFQPPHT